MGEPAGQWRAAWDKQGWPLYCAVALALLALGVWILTTNRPGTAGVPFGLSIGFLVRALYVFRWRNQR